MRFGPPPVILALVPPRVAASGVSAARGREA